MAVLYAGAEWIGPAYPDNFMVGRQGNAVTAIVAHHTASTFEGAVARFTSSSGVSGGGTSAHFIVRIDGSRYQLVDTADTAFHAGNFQANLTTIGIEHEQTWDFGAGVKTSDFSDAQYQSSHELCSILAADSGFPLDGNHLRPHSFYSQTACPGDLDLARIMEGLNLSQLDDIWQATTQGSGNGRIMSAVQALDAKVSALKLTGGSVDLAPVLAAIADLKAHPTVASDPALLAAILKIDSHFTGK